MAILVTGGAGFIGSNFILDWFRYNDELVINLDKLTYAGNPENLKVLNDDSYYRLIPGNITNTSLLEEIFNQYPISSIVHFAAESHVDRSILKPDAFIDTNIVGTYKLLDTAKQYWSNLTESAKTRFRFIHVSTDEVFGSLEKDTPAFTEQNRYEPNSPYAASKAASDHLVRAFHQTYGFPSIITHCSNNYGPYQFPEKFIPLCIHHALEEKPIPLYGDGQQIRDWLHVSDHCAALRCLLKQGEIGETYNIGGWNEKTNLEVLHFICNVLDQEAPRANGKPYHDFITFVTDRPGHDRRYAINSNKIHDMLGWKPQETFETGIKKTITWYLQHPDWIRQVTSGQYQRWIKQQYAVSESQS